MATCSVDDVAGNSVSGGEICVRVGARFTQLINKINKCYSNLILILFYINNYLNIIEHNLSQF